MLVPSSIRAVRTAGFALALVLLGVSSPGQTSYAYEGFDYGVTASPVLLDGTDGGAGWASPWMGINQPTGLISFWPLDHTAADAGPAAAHGFLVGAATYSTEVPPGLYWSGSSLSLPQAFGQQRGYLDLTARVGTFANLNKGSITMWVKVPIQQAAAVTTLISASNTTTTYGFSDFGIRIQNGQVQGGSRGRLYAGGHTITSQTQINDDNWHHIAFTVDGAANAVLYIDGQVEATGRTGFFGSAQGLNQMAIGRNVSSGGGTNYFVGLIDEVAIWGSPLTPADVRRLSFVGAPLTFPPLVTGPNEPLGPSLASETLAKAGTNPAFESGGFHAFGNRVSDATGNRAGRVMTTPLNMGNDDTYYLSCLVRRIDPPSGAITPAEVQLTSYDRIGGRFGWDDQGAWFAGIDTNTTTGATYMNPNVEYWVILKIQAASLYPFDQVFMRVYEGNQTIPADDTGFTGGQGTANNQWTVVVSPGAILNVPLDQLWLVQNQAGSTFEIDEIRVGTTWQSVTRVGYGAGCLGHRIGVTNRPLLGASNFSVDLHGAQPNASALLLLGLSPLALPLGGIGAPSCSLLTSAELSALQLTDGAGNAVAPLSIPNVAALYGQSLYAQWVAAAPTQPLPLAFSDGYQMLIEK